MSSQRRRSPVFTGKTGTVLLLSIGALAALVLAACAPPTPGQEPPAQSLNGDTEATPWGYWGDGAPNNWGTLSPDFATCAEGTRQAPINITGYREDAAAPPLSFTYRHNAQEVVHDGRIASVNYGEGNELNIGELTYGLKTAHIHVHAEHQIDQQLFAAELHLVHQQQSGGYAVVARLYSLGAPDPVVQALIDAYPQPGQTRESGFTLNAADYLPGELGYYRYQGSKTTPPCAEPVDWIVLREIGSISQEQANQLAALHNGFNHRPIQPGNDRDITYRAPGR